MRAHERPLASVDALVRLQPLPDLELFAAGGALELVAVAAAAVLAVLPPHPALEGLAAVRAYEGLLAGVGVEVLLELALEAEDLAANLAGVLVIQEYLVRRGHVPVLVLGDGAAQVAAPLLLDPHLLYGLWRRRDDDARLSLVPLHVVGPLALLGEGLVARQAAEQVRLGVAVERPLHGVLQPELREPLALVLVVHRAVLPQQVAREARRAPAGRAQLPVAGLADGRVGAGLDVVVPDDRLLRVLAHRAVVRLRRRLQARAVLAVRVSLEAALAALELL